MTNKSKIDVYTDGGSRGNPGKAACGFVIFENGKELFRGSKFLGIKTNNQAEYSGVSEALDKLIEEGFDKKEVSISFYLDSELVVRQLSGIYKIKNEDLRNYFFTIKQKEKKFLGLIIYSHVPREKNTIADLLLNDCLDKN